MNPRALILIALAGVAFVLVFFLTRTFLANSGPQQAAPVSQPVAEAPAAEVLVAVVDLPVGTIVNQEHYVQQGWPENLVSEAYYQVGGEEASNPIGKVVRTPIQGGTPITRSALVAPGQRGFMAAILNPGMRAVTIGLNAESSIGGFIYPGDRVDVILTHLVKRESGSHNVGETVLSNVRVLGVDQASAKDQTGVAIRQTATLEVTPKMAEKIAIMNRIGRLTLALRSLRKTEKGLSSDPDSPPVPYTSTLTQGSEISGFLPTLGKKSEQGIIVYRGAKRSILKVDGGSNGDSDDEESDDSGDL